jgi:Uma2 family endonuclease
MYESSENLKEIGLPDEFHSLQPQLLSMTFRPASFPPDQVFTASHLNLFYHARYQSWFKKPDWFAVVRVPRLYEGEDLRLNYAIWQEGVSPFVVVELLSPGSETEDLGKTESSFNQVPTKWEVYEQLLRVPYYIVFNRYNNQLRAFTLQAGRYQELKLTEPRVWMPELELGLDLWQGDYQGIKRLWLRWYDAQGNWIPTDGEAAKQQLDAERQRAEAAEKRANTAEQRAESLAQRLKELGVEI